MREEYKQFIEEARTPANAETSAAWDYAEKVLGKNRPTQEAPQWAVLESLLQDQRESVGDAVVFTCMCGFYVGDRRERYGQLSATDFLLRIKDAVVGTDSYAVFIREQGIPGVTVGTDTPCWSDFCAWVFYALASTRQTQ